MTAIPNESKPTPRMIRETVRACSCCGKVHRVGVEKENLGQCTRCGTGFRPLANRQAVAQRTMAAAVGALILFFPAVLLPILTVEQLGQRHRTSLLGGSIELIQHGSLLVGTIVLVFSIILPFIKMLGLLELSWFGLLSRNQQAIMVRWMELVSRWSMLDVLLLALLVMMVKLGGIVEFHLGPAVFAFVGCVAMNMLASYSFDPHVIWEDDDQ